MTSRISFPKGTLVTDGWHQFRIVNGLRIWVSDPPPALRQELLIEAARLHLSRSLRPKLP